MLYKLLKETEKLENDFKKVGSKDDMLSHAEYLRDIIIPDSEKLRKSADELETLVGKDDWAFPTYEDILSSVAE